MDSSNQALELESCNSGRDMQMGFLNYAFKIGVNTPFLPQTVTSRHSKASFIPRVINLCGKKKILKGAANNLAIIGT